MVSIKLVSDSIELEGIKKLQHQNLKNILSDSEIASQGFVTAEYSLEFLDKMHLAAPSVLAKDQDEVVGYALVSIHSIRAYHDLLADLFNCIDRSEYQGEKLAATKYVVVGQLCVAKEYRGMGIVDQMYQYFKKQYSKEFQYCITDIAQDNPRSLKAHLKTGFQVIDTLTYGGVSWDIVLWDWNA